MRMYPSLVSGLSGAIVLTLLHQVLKKNVSAAPRMDKLARQGLSKVLPAIGSKVPPADDLQKIALGGDIIGNAAYYSLVGIKPGYGLMTGAALGATAGLAALTLPRLLGLGREYSSRTTKTEFLTVFLYLAGGLAAGAVYNNLEREKS